MKPTKPVKGQKKTPARRSNAGAAKPELVIKTNDPSAFMAMHTPMIGWHVYTQQLNQGIADNLSDTAFKYLADTLLRMKTRDPLEEMLVVQALWSHTRLARLSAIANQQTQTNNVKVVNDACDPASNTFRRQML